MTGKMLLSEHSELSHTRSGLPGRGGGGAGYGTTLSKLWNTMELRKATMLQARGPVAYANMTCGRCILSREMPGVLAEGGRVTVKSQKFAPGALVEGRDECKSSQARGRTLFMSAECGSSQSWTSISTLAADQGTQVNAVRV